VTLAGTIVHPDRVGPGDGYGSARGLRRHRGRQPGHARC